MPTLFDSPVALNYNSQNWRRDVATTYKLGADVGYGFGWRLMAGSLTPIYSSPTTFLHYLFTDASGAEYKLDVNTGGVWSSKEGIYVRINFCHEMEIHVKKQVLMGPGFVIQQ